MTTKENILDQNVIYQKIGEFVVSFQWLENKLRETGWFILDPSREHWPPTELRNLTNERLVNKVHQLFLEVLPRCQLESNLEKYFRENIDICKNDLHAMRRKRNKILHSAFIELKVGGEVKGIIRSDPKIAIDEETGESLFDNELLTEQSFKDEMHKMGELAIFLNQCYIQLIQRLPKNKKYGR